MTDGKLFKDPIYGYIEIPKHFVSIVIDSPEFQRLRRITQTSYAPVFSSAVHNRFVHSIGVYHLGSILMDHICSESTVKRFANKSNNFDVERTRCIFLLACLLHDVGHAPFSHTGEDLFLNDKEKNNEKDIYETLHKQLQDVVGTGLERTIIPDNRSQYAAAHEIMSAIIGIQSFPDLFVDSFSKEFFARCITGYQFTGKSKEESLYNCFISFLNSNMIDVDKLDYLIRDAFITGFATVNIDYLRLLNSITIVLDTRTQRITEQRFIVAYSKNAISIIESVIFAHDAEKKWIQSHPVILYESYLLFESMKQIKKIFSDHNVSLFSSIALGTEGVSLPNSQSQEDNQNLFPKRIRLLSDDDILFMMKNLQLTNYSGEYFDRKNWMHPVWKSEAEYNAIVKATYSEDNKALRALFFALGETMNFIDGCDKYRTITEDLPGELDNEIKKLKENEDSFDEDTYQDNLNEKERIKKVIITLFDEAKKTNLKTEFLLLKASAFQSGFAKPDFNKIAVLPAPDIIVDFNKAVNSMAVDPNPQPDFFFLFYKRATDSDGNTLILNSKSLIDNLVNAFKD